MPSIIIIVGIVPSILLFDFDVDFIVILLQLIAATNFSAGFDQSYSIIHFKPFPAIFSVSALSSSNFIIPSAIDEGFFISAKSIFFPLLRVGIQPTFVATSAHLQAMASIGGRCQPSLWLGEMKIAAS